MQPVVAVPKGSIRFLLGNFFLGLFHIGGRVNEHRAFAFNVVVSKEGHAAQAIDRIEAQFHIQAGKRLLDVFPLEHLAAQKRRGRVGVKLLQIQVDQPLRLSRYVGLVQRPGPKRTAQQQHQTHQMQ